MIISRLLTEDPEILGVTVQNLVALGPGICSPLVSVSAVLEEEEEEEEEEEKN